MGHEFLQTDLETTGRRGPKYEQLKGYLLQEVAAGRLRGGDMLPSEKSLANSLQIARNTVRLALAALEKDGVVSRIRGKGTFINSPTESQRKSALDLVALVVPETENGHYPAMLRGFERTSAEQHRQTLVCCSNNDIYMQSAILMQLLDREVGGLAIVPTAKPATPTYQLVPLKNRGIPLVFCHRRVEGIKAPIVAIPFHRVGRMAGEEMATCGHRRVAMIGPWTDAVCTAYESGLREALQAHGGDLPKEHIYLGNRTEINTRCFEGHVRQSLEHLVGSSPRPTAIFATFDDFAELTYLILGEMGLKVPQDISLVGFGGVHRESFFAQRLTSVAVDGAALGANAANLLQEIIAGDRPRDDNEEIFAPLSITAGQTLAPPC